MSEIPLATLFPTISVNDEAHDSENTPLTFHTTEESRDSHHKLCSRQEACLATAFFVGVTIVVLLIMYPQEGWSDRKKSHDGAVPLAATPHNYTLALQLSTIFFDAQKSGNISGTNRTPWRQNSGLRDGNDVGVDLSGGFYDAGDHIKFGLPLAFTLTMLSWTGIQFKIELQAAGEFDHLLDIVRWGTDYLIKAHANTNVLYVQVGDAQLDHNCWERAEDMTTPRTAYQINATCPGSDVAGETAAALAAASILFAPHDSAYSQQLLLHATQLFHFAHTHRGKYSSCIPEVSSFYDSSGYLDELLWSATWLLSATRNASFLQFLLSPDFAALQEPAEFSWDDKTAGALVLLAGMDSTLTAGGEDPGLTETVMQEYKRAAQKFVCLFFPTEHMTPDGLLWLHEWTPAQYTVNVAFLLQYYAVTSMNDSSKLMCPHGEVIDRRELQRFSQRQVDYLLGNNKENVSYVVGYGSNYPLYVHHRGASIPSISEDKTKYDCTSGWKWFFSKQPNPNIISGALVGGPTLQGVYHDERDNYKQNEVAIYMNAPLVGLLASLSGNFTGR